MPVQLLLYSQENWFIEAIRHAGLDPTEFKREALTDSGYDLFGIVHEPTQSFFGTTPHYRFEDIGDHYLKWLSIRSPARERRFERLFGSQWLEVQSAFRDWLQFVEREHAQPDLWAQLAEAPALGRMRTDFADTGEFSREELGHIRKALAQLKEFLVQEATTQEQADFVVKRITYLEEAATRSGCRDWMNIAVGTLVSIGIELTMNGAAFNGLLAFASNALKDVPRLG